MASFDIAVIGAGITGLTAAHHAALDGWQVVCLQENDLLGGLVVNVGELEGYPSPGSLSGAELATTLADRNRELGVSLVCQRVEALELAPDAKVLKLADGSTITAAQVIVATGARLKQLGVPGERELAYRGVSQCAWCDAGLFRGDDVVVVGGGDAALEEALHLAKFCSSVTIVTRGDGFKARQSYVTRAAEDERFRFRWNTDVTDIVGETGVEAVRLRDRIEGRVEDLPCRGVFVFIGQSPNACFLGPEVARDEHGYLVTDTTLETSLAGVYAAGAVRSGYNGRLTSAVGEATAAALGASRRLASV